MSAPKKDPRHRAQGMIARATGQAFESRLNAAFAYYAAKGLAVIEKTPEPMKIIRPLEKGQFICVFSHRAQPDYQGTAPGGISVMLEAKHTTGNQLYRSKVTDNQLDYLRRHSALGAKCYVLAGFGSNGKTYRVPFAVWDDMKKIYGRKYVTPVDLEDYEIMERYGVLLILHRTKGEHHD